MDRRRVIVAAPWFLLTGAFAQTTFEVASVKANRSGSPQSRSLARRSFVAENLTLKAIICLAFDIPDVQVRGGPAWINSERWDIIAKPGEPVPADSKGDETMRSMAQALLAERFHLRVHRKIEKVAGYALLVAKGGPKLKASDLDKFPGDSVGNSMIRGSRMPMARLTRLLSGLLGEIVVDQTRLPGEFNIALNFAPLNPNVTIESSTGDQPSLFTALQEVGLRLDHRGIPAELLYIDSAERPDSN